MMPDPKPQSKMSYAVRNNAALRRDTPLDQMEAANAHMCVGLQRSTEAIYFARCDHHVKIGWSKNLAKRVRDHARTASRFGQTYQIVAAVYGTRSEEDRLHTYFKDCQIGREEFAHADTLTDYIRWLRGNYFVQVPEEWAGELIQEVPVVDYQGWAPSPERRIPYEPNLFCDQSKYEKRVVMGDDYYTPVELIERIRMAFGEIDLDPASHAAANAKIGAKRYYTKAEDGLRRPWYGRVWLNPPFGDWPQFAEKLIEEWRRGEIDALLALVSCMALTTQYLEPVLATAQLCIVPPKRYKFWGPHATEPTNGHVILGFARNATDLDGIQSAFDGMGVSWRPWK